MSRISVPTAPAKLIKRRSALLDHVFLLLGCAPSIGRRAPVSMGGRPSASHFQYATESPWTPVFHGVARSILVTTSLQNGVCYGGTPPWATEYPQEPVFHRGGGSLPMSDGNFPWGDAKDENTFSRRVMLIVGCDCKTLV